jgi:hypothetical protein
MIYQYLTRLQALLDSRQEIHVERFDARQLSALDGRIAGRLRFYDGSILEFREEFRVRNRKIMKVIYAYHYQRADGSLVFRYDNAPHHPELQNFPCHVHIGDHVEPADPPDLHDVLRKIDGYVSGSG